MCQNSNLSLILLIFLRYSDKTDNCRVILKLKKNHIFTSNFGTNVQYPEQIKNIEVKFCNYLYVVTLKLQNFALPSYIVFFLIIMIDKIFLMDYFSIEFLIKNKTLSMLSEF